MSHTHAQLLLGTEHDCGYLPERRARSAFLDPMLPLAPDLYGSLLDQGFRRSGGYAYRPLCGSCNACRSVRIRVNDFVPNRSQKRCLQRNSDLTLQTRRRMTNEHFQLYQRYLSARHPNGGMDPHDAEAFREFLGCPWGDTAFWEFRLREKLLAVAVVDRVPRGLSAVYTFFSPDEPARGLGTYAILQQVERGLRDGLPYVYLGYWVPGSRKMDYKKAFQPLEVLSSTGWRRMPRSED